MKLRFAPGADSATWPPLPPGLEAAFGEITVGPQGLRRILEGEVGLLGPEEPQAVRAARLIPELQRTSGFWSASLQVDPFGVAHTLMDWIDDLKSEGWDGAAGGERLTSLAALADIIAGGGPERLKPLAAAILAHGTDVRKLTLLEPRTELPLLLRNILDTLETKGTKIREQSVDDVHSKGDLAAATRDGFEPRGDGSLQLVRAAGPLAAAGDLAAWLARQEGHQQTLIIGADVVLDQALHRHGLPTSGATEASDNSLLQVLPLVLQLAVAPANPQRALELLTLPSGPVPVSIARRLASALQKTPAVGAERWAEALQNGLEAIEDQDRRTRVKARIEALFEQPLARDLYPSGVLRDRTALVHDWLQLRLQVAISDDEDVSRWAAAIGQCRALLELLAASGLSELTAPMLQRLLRGATDAIHPCARLPASAGLQFVSSPDAMLGTCDTVIWWDFQRAGAPRPRRSPFRVAERRSLAASGVKLIDAGDLALRCAERWSRPLRLARQRLILICPEVGLDGSALELHPLWDEISARLCADASTKSISTEALASGLSKPAEVLGLPEPQHLWTVPKTAVMKRKIESPSSLEKFLGCPLRWVLEYGGKVRSGGSARLTADERLVGSLVHEVVACVLNEAPWKDADDAGVRARELFDILGPQTAALLFQPEAAALRAKARLAAAASVVSLLGHLANAGLKPARVEQKREAATFIGTLRGTADLVTGPAPVVVDLKWGGVGYRRTSLAKGAALQLAAYAALESSVQTGAEPDAAYFILRDQKLITTSDKFPAAERVKGATPQETWLGTEQAWKQAWKEAQAGALRARGVSDPVTGGPGAPNESHLDDAGVLQSAAGCGFCEYGALCGRGVDG